MLLENWYFNNRDIEGYMHQFFTDWGGKGFKMGTEVGKCLIFWDRKQPTVTSFDEDKYRGVRLVDL